jgi:hypothetical protein
VVIYGFETWSLVIREEQRLRTFGPKRDEVTLGWGKLVYNEELHNLYSSPNIKRIIK